VDPTASLDDLEERKFLTLPGLELRTIGRPARSRSVYRLHYPGYPISLRSILTLSTHLRFGLPSSSFLLAFPPICYMHSSSSLFRIEHLPHTSLACYRFIDLLGMTPCSLVFIDALEERTASILSTES
jgi:hypothetical protein